MALRRSKIAPRGLKTAPRCPKLAPRWPKWAPSWPPGTVPEAPWKSWVVPGGVLGLPGRHGGSREAHVISVPSNLGVFRRFWRLGPIWMIEALRKPRGQAGGVFARLRRSSEVLLHGLERPATTASRWGGGFQTLTRTPPPHVRRSGVLLQALDGLVLGRFWAVQGCPGGGSWPTRGRKADFHENPINSSNFQ